MSDYLWPPVLYSPGNSLGQNTRGGSLSLLQGIFPTQGLYPGLPHCRQILYRLSYKGSPRTLEWVAYPFSGRSSWPRDWTRVSCITGEFFTNWGISSVQFSRSVVSDSFRPHESQHDRPPCPWLTPGVHSDSRPSSQWCHPAISFSVVPCSCPQSFPASGSFQMSQLSASGGHSRGQNKFSAQTSVSF